MPRATSSEVESEEDWSAQGDSLVSTTSSEALESLDLKILSQCEEKIAEELSRMVFVREESFVDSVGVSQESCDQPIVPCAVSDGSREQLLEGNPTLDSSGKTKDELFDKRKPIIISDVVIKTVDNRKSELFFITVDKRNIQKKSA